MLYPSPGHSKPFDWAVTKPYLKHNADPPLNLNLDRSHIVELTRFVKILSLFSYLRYTLPTVDPAAYRRHHTHHAT